MFSAQNSTPHKRSSNASVPFSSPTFSTLGSSFKRKRDQIERSDAKPVVQNFVAVVQRSGELAVIESAHEVLFTKLFPTGDIVMLKRLANSYCNLCFYHDASKAASPKVSNIAWPQKHLEAMENVFDIGKGFDLSTDLVACSKQGSLILINIAADGAVSATEHKVLLSEEGERITSICHAG